MVLLSEPTHQAGEGVRFRDKSGHGESISPPTFRSAICTLKILAKAQKFGQIEMNPI